MAGVPDVSNAARTVGAGEPGHLRGARNARRSLLASRVHLRTIDAAPAIEGDERTEARITAASLRSAVRVSGLPACQVREK
jgi:hypothetical protein